VPPRHAVVARATVFPSGDRNRPDRLECARLPVPARLRDRTDRQIWRANLAAHAGRATGRAVVMSPTTAPDAIRIGTKTRRVNFHAPSNLVTSSK
jgi:hypothetical protein